MKQLISISLISMILLILVNCSPKTSKSSMTSSSDKKEASTPNTTSTSSSSNSSSSTSSTSSSSSSRSSTNTNSALINKYMTLSSDQVSKGKMLFETNCKKCHELYSPKSRNEDNWILTMKEMGPKANLSPEHYTMVSAYLVQNAKK